MTGDDDDDDDDDDDQTTVTVPAEVTKYTTEYLKQLFLHDQQAVHDDNRQDPIVTLELWDFAGQHLYYASHPIFFSPRGVYVLVHNLSEPLDALAEPCVRQGLHDIFLENPNGETNMENLLSWLVTVHGSRPIGGECVGKTEREDLAYLRPPVIIVGTHADKPVEDINVITSQIQRGISGKEYEKHVIRPFFNVDNTTGNKSTITRTRKDLVKRPFKGQQAGIAFVCTVRAIMNASVNQRPNQNLKAFALVKVKIRAREYPQYTFQSTKNYTQTRVSVKPGTCPEHTLGTLEYPGSPLI